MNCTEGDTDMHTCPKGEENFEQWNSTMLLFAVNGDGLKPGV
jgi:hypothetical protein